MIEPTQDSILTAFKLYTKIGYEAFLEEFSSGFPPKAHYISNEQVIAPLKALWAASHSPPIHTREFTTAKAKIVFSRLGFVDFVEGDLSLQYEEGERQRKEIEVIARAPALVKAIKSKFPAVCRACDFDFGKKYGQLGIGYIECHHIDPLSGREGKSKITSIADLVLVCANCHRMIHREARALTVDQLRAKIAEADDATSN